MSVAPGIYSARALDYGSIDAVNFSTLKAISKSPLHYRHHLTAPDEPTDAKRLGELAHAAVLEPETLAARFAVWPAEHRRAGKAWDAFVTDNEAMGRTVIRSVDLDAALRIAAAVRRHPCAARYLKAGHAEQILVWRDEATGILCKGRVDWISTSVPDVMCELKTSRDVSPWFFEANFARRAFDVQAAFYADGYQAITGRALYPKCIASENVEPYDVIVYDLLETVDVGRALYREMLERLAECRRANAWPGQAPHTERILRLPPWRDPAEQDDDLADLQMETNHHV